jgi:hypothetical protein
MPPNKLAEFLAEIETMTKERGFIIIDQGKRVQGRKYCAFIRIEDWLDQPEPIKPQEETK